MLKLGCQRLRCRVASLLGAGAIATRTICEFVGAHVLCGRSTRSRRGTARQSKKPADEDDSDMSPPPRTRASAGARRAPKRSRDESDADSPPPRRRGKATSKSSGAKATRGKSTAKSSRRTGGSRSRRRSDEDSGSEEGSDSEPLMPPYPKKISRAALAACGELGPMAGLRDLAEKAASGDATAIRRACVGTEFEFVADVAARTAQFFTAEVGEFLAGVEQQLNQLSPGVRPGRGAARTQSVAAGPGIGTGARNLGVAVGGVAVGRGLRLTRTLCCAVGLRLTHD